MSEIGHNFPPLDALPPIPEDVKPGKGWTAQMLEMADHIGAYATLRLVERFGGMRIYIPADWTRGKSYEDRGSIADVIGDEAAEKLSEIYRREYLAIPTAKPAIARARRQALIASVRAGRITASKVARSLGSTRPYVSHLVNHTDEGDTEALPPARRQGRLPGQPDLFGEE